ncbi:MAG: hypothetical protein HY401_06090 [Elusimicrobia bacterium]|nr:hypothetical protein [Elusimicrobiota bacterium]
MESRLKAVIALAVLTASLAPPINALGLKTSTGEIMFSGIEPGKLWRLPGSSKKGFSLLNTSPNPETVELSIGSPGAADQLKNGFLPIPRAGWIWLANPVLTLPAHSAGTTDIYVFIPENIALNGNTFQAYLTARLKLPANSTAVSAGVRVPILLKTTGSQSQNSPFTFSDSSITLKIQRGKKLSLTKLAGKAVSLTNQTSQTEAVELRWSAPSGERLAAWDRTGLNAGESSWASAKSPVAIKTRQTKKVDAYLQVSSQINPGGYALILEAAPLESQLASVAELFVRLDVQ